MTWIGFDVGGTFIDIVAWDGSALTCHKVSSDTADRLAERVLAGVGEALARTGSEEPVAALAHGTTVATNTLIERSGAPVGLITTQGFRDILEIGRMTRKDHFNLFVQKVPPLAPRMLRLEVDERVDADGVVVTPLRREQVEAAAQALVDQGAQAVAIAFMNSYRNPAHEAQAAAWIAASHPQLSVSQSSQVSAEYGEFERTSTAVLNEYLRPRMGNYLGELEDGFQRLGIAAPLRIIQSNGGRIPVDTSSRYPVRLLRSGPAAGVSGARRCALDVSPNLITFDMGGTSTDVSVVVDGKPLYTSETDVDGYTARVVMSDIRSIGAGGGSLVRVDASGSLHVGPRSAGAHPGPMCYGEGGEIATVTDANVVLGYLNPERFCAGATRLDAALAHRGIEEQVAGPVGVTVPEAALGVARVAVTNMAGAVRTVATEHGKDLRDFVLVAFGGAGPVYAPFVAQELEMKRVLVPRLPGLLCAFGLLVSEFRADSWRTYPRLLSDVTADELAASFAELEAEAHALLTGGTGASNGASRVTYERRVEMCYQGQRHEIGITLPDEPIAAQTLKWLDRELHRAFVERYRFAPRDGRPQLVNLRVFATEGQGSHDALLSATASEPVDAARPARPVSTRRAYFPDAPQGVDVPVHDRSALAVGEAVHGPAIVEEDYSTVVVPPGQTCSRLASGDLLIETTNP